MIEVRDLKKAYRPKKGNAVQALKGINLQFEETGLVFILGKSGSGKSTLLNMLGGLDQFDDGEIIIKGKSSKAFGQADFDSYRNTFIGFIFQEYNILNDFTVGANIALAMELQGKKPTNEMLNKILEEVDLAGFANRKPNELSGGQKQRVAIARALIKNPEIIMADEPTGALDSNTGKQVFDTLKRLAKEKLVIVVSHDREFAEQYGDRVIEMRDGEVISDIKKYTAESAKVNEGIQIIEDKIIHIKSGYELTVDDMNMINDYLKKNKEHDSFISLDDRTNDKIKQVAQIDEDGNQEAFMDTSAENLTIPEYDGSKLQFIKSKLPFKSSIKMAAGSLKKKPFRLVMTIFLSVVAFTLFGLVNTMSAYDKMKAGTDSIIDSNVDYISFMKKQNIKDGSGFEFYRRRKLSDDDVDKIQKKFPENKFLPVASDYNQMIEFGQNIFSAEKLSEGSGVQYHPASFAGVASITDDVIKTMGYELKGTLPTKDNEIVITKVVADSFIAAGYREATENAKEQAISSVDQMIGKTIALSVGQPGEYTVTGILDTKFDDARYASLKETKKSDGADYAGMMMQFELQNVYETSYHTVLYTTQTVFDHVLNSNKIFRSEDSSEKLELGFEELNPNVDQFIEYSNLDEEMKSNVFFFNENKKTLEPGEIIAPCSMLEVNMDFENIIYSDKSQEQKVKDILRQKSTIESLVVQSAITTATSGRSFDAKVVGIYMDMDSNHRGMAILSDGFFDRYQVERSGKYAFLLGKMPEDRAGVSDVLAYSYDCGIENVRYTLQNCTTDMLETVNDIVEVLSKVFLWVGVVFAVFASLMLMNFITTSISYRKREIGILRAVGARGRDVFMIFFQESVIIALINWLISLGATAAIVKAANTGIRNEYNFVVTVLHFGALQVAIMFVLCVGVAFVSCFFPVFKVSKKKPIEVIRKN